jgi:hypothetical protein
MRTLLIFATTAALLPSFGAGEEFLGGFTFNDDTIDFEITATDDRQTDFRQVVFTPNSDGIFVREAQGSLGILPGESPATGTDQAPRPFDLTELMRPTFSLAAEWQAKASDIGLASYEARVQVPTYPIFGPPPPFINLGFSYTDLNAPVALDLPADMYDYSFGFSWMRPINERWMLRSMFSTALATDGKNNSSDAWQFRGGLFAMYRPNERWTWIVGALALGRNDIPAVPALGAIWQPNPGLRFNLTLPQPKVAFLLRDNGPRQQWGYVGAGLNGGTWAYERSSGIDDQLTYRDWRLVIGWESTPTPEPGMPFTRGRKMGLEVGYVFARKLEFEGGLPDISLDDSLMLRATASF